MERYHTPKSLNGIISDCYQSFNESIATAKQIEDYRYLHEMVSNREDNENKFCFFWNYKHSLPTVMEKNVDCNVDVLANLSLDHQDVIPEQEFISLIESISDNESLSPKLYIERFKNLVEAKKVAYRLEHEKIQRNEKCPCGSGKKYKYCHGSVHVENVK